eukprot:scaffold676_cov73-Phaeocystis_antarctica.AAC.7
MGAAQGVGPAQAGAADAAGAAQGGAGWLAACCECGRRCELPLRSAHPEMWTPLLFLASLASRRRKRKLHRMPCAGLPIRSTAQT